MLAKNSYNDRRQAAYASVRFSMRIRSGTDPPAGRSWNTDVIEVCLVSRPGQACLKDQLRTTRTAIPLAAKPQYSDEEWSPTPPCITD